MGENNVAYTEELLLHQLDNLLAVRRLDGLKFDMQDALLFVALGSPKAECAEV
jgi:hypothetical protein